MYVCIHICIDDLIMDVYGWIVYLNVYEYCFFRYVKKPNIYIYLNTHVYICIYIYISTSIHMYTETWGVGGRVTVLYQILKRACCR